MNRSEIYKITNANIKEWAANYNGEPFDAILCDPPYELGFMGKSWDNTGIAFDKDMWADLLRILKPGGHLLAFSGSRTYHRMAVAIEDAGFEIRDMIEWVYGSGFPKSLNIGKQLNKQEGVEFEEIPASGVGFMKADSEDWNVTKNQLIQSGESTENGKKWNGYGTALKPAHEPCVLARKPIEGTVANNVLKYGTGGLNIDGSRVEAEPELAKNWDRVQSTKQGIASTGINAIDLRDRVPTGRFPANLIHDGSDEVVGLFPNSKGMVTQNSSTDLNVYTGNALYHSKTKFNAVRQGFNDNGSASRFFYTAKASKSERNAGCEELEEKEGGSLEGGADTRGGVIKTNQPMRTNNHPTVKPLSLTKYLATLIKPPTGGRLLVPFSGSGSEMIGALQAGWEYVEGVELTEEYIPIAEARIKYWLEQKLVEEAKPEQVAIV